MHPGRQLAVLGLVFVILYLLVFFAGGAKGSFNDRLHPKLGLDLVGGTQATYIASVQGGQVPSKESMEQARGIIEERVNALGVAEAEVVIQGDRNIVVSLAGKAEDQLKDLSQAAQMRFRMLIGVTGDVAATALNPPSAAPSGSAAAVGGRIRGRERPGGKPGRLHGRPGWRRGRQGAEPQPHVPVPAPPRRRPPRCPARRKSPRPTWRRRWARPHGPPPPS